MILNIKERATKIKLGYSVFIIVYLLLLVLSLIFTFTPNYLFEIIWSAVCITAFILFIVMDYNYIYYTNEGDKIIFRYQALNPFIVNPKSIEIPKRSFYKFEFTKSLFGKKTNILFYQKTKDGVAKYSPVSLTALTKKEREELDNSLKGFLK